MIKEKTFYKSFMVLALSLALQNLLTYGVNLMDTMMLGRYSQDAMGGVSLCNQVQFLLQMLHLIAQARARSLWARSTGAKTSWSRSLTSSVWLCASAVHWRC